MGRTEVKHCRWRDFVGIPNDPPQNLQMTSKWHIIKRPYPGANNGAKWGKFCDWIRLMNQQGFLILLIASDSHASTAFWRKLSCLFPTPVSTNVTSFVNAISNLLRTERRGNSPTSKKTVELDDFCERFYKVWFYRFFSTLLMFILQCLFCFSTIKLCNFSISVWYRFLMAS